MLKIIINGADGRMGKELKQAIGQNKQTILIGEITQNSNIAIINKICSQADLIIDFSIDAGTNNILNYASEFSLPILIGTTKLSENTSELIKKNAQKIPIIYAANTSIGANLIDYFTGKLAKLVKDYDVEIIEKHHSNKIDAPSGTALSIGETVAQARQLDFAQHAVFNRAGKGKRISNDISFASIRGGNIFGEHEIIFAGETELITLSHQATSRLAFAQGALIAALWLVKQPVGLYTMRDVLKLKSCS